MSDTTRTTRRRCRPASAEQRLVTMQQGAQITGLPYTTIRDLHLRGHLPVVKLPGSRRWWIEREALERLIERSVVAGPVSNLVRR